MPREVNIADLELARLIISLLAEGEIRQPVAGDFEWLLPPGTDPSAVAVTFPNLRGNLPELAGQPTGHTVEVRFEGVELLRVEPLGHGAALVHGRAMGENSIIAVRLVE
jgi:hypothetical protein